MKITFKCSTCTKAFIKALVWRHSDFLALMSRQLVPRSEKSVSCRRKSRINSLRFDDTTLLQQQSQVLNRYSQENPSLQTSFCILKVFAVMDKKALDARANQCNPDHTRSGPGRAAGYHGAGTKADLDNHGRQLNPNNPLYQAKK